MSPELSKQAMPLHRSDSGSSRKPLVTLQLNDRYVYNYQRNLLLENATFALHSGILCKYSLRTMTIDLITPTLIISQFEHTNPKSIPRKVLLPRISHRTQALTHTQRQLHKLLTRRPPLPEPRPQPSSASFIRVLDTAIPRSANHASPLPTPASTNIQAVPLKIKPKQAFYVHSTCTSWIRPYKRIGEPLQLDEFKCTSDTARHCSRYE